MDGLQTCLISYLAFIAFVSREVLFDLTTIGLDFA